MPDYAAYEPLLGSFGKVQSIPLQLSERNKFKLTVEQLRQEIHDRGLTAVLLSNPRNPCGTLIEGEELRELVELSLRSDTTMIVDEVRSAECLQVCAKLTRRSSTPGTCTRAPLAVPCRPRSTSRIPMSATWRSSTA